VEIEVEARGFKTEKRSVALPGDYDFTLSPEDRSEASGGQRRRSPRGGGA
jgi:hypothetical protein